MTIASSKSPVPRCRGAVLTKATLRAAKRLGMTREALGSVIGVSPSSVSRMYTGNYMLRPTQKPFELAVMFVRFYRSLDCSVGGDDVMARAWLRNPNEALNGAPIALIQSVPGLMNVIHYLDARRAVA